MTMAAGHVAADTSGRADPRPAVPVLRCPCGFLVVDGAVLRARVVRLDVAPPVALCKCKRWLELPLWISRW